MIMQYFSPKDSEQKRLVYREIERPSHEVLSRQVEIDNRLQALRERVELNTQEDLEEQYPDQGVEMKKLVGEGIPLTRNYSFLSSMLGQSLGEWTPPEKGAQPDPITPDNAPKTFQVLHLLVKAGKNVNADANLKMEEGDRVKIDSNGLMAVIKKDGSTRYQINLAQ